MVGVWVSMYLVTELLLGPVYEYVILALLTVDTAVRSGGSQLQTKAPETLPADESVALLSAGSPLGVTCARRVVPELL